MSNILKVSSPIPQSDPNTNARVAQDNLKQNRNIQGEIRPDQVMRPDARSDAAANKQEAELKFRYETNFDNFIQQMAKSPGLSKDFGSVFLERLATLAQSGLKQGFAGNIAQFLNMISMSPQEMASFLKMQGDSSVRFSGAFFDILRQIMQQTGSIELRTGILDFMKKYTDMSEGKHLLNNMEQLLQNIKESMLKSPRGEVDKMAQQLNYNAANGNVKQNASILKDQIMPFLNKYITQMHERGSMRENTALLGALTARYENGDVTRLQESFLRLMDYSAFSERFKNMDAATLLKVLENSEFEKASNRNDAMKQLGEIIKRGVAGEAGIENKMVFKELMRALLLNESVYMPVLHLTLPLNVNGRLMFSEMWLDPNDDGKGFTGAGRERFVKGLIKFDIKDVGFFDLFFLYGTETEKISIQLNYPKDLDASEGEIRTALGKILTENGIEQEEIVLGTEDGTIPISAAFPTVFERKNSINVTV